MRFPTWKGISVGCILTDGYCPKQKRARLYNLKPDRADVITHAADIFLLVAEHTQAKHIVVPTIGLMDGIIDSLYLQHHKTPEEQIPPSPFINKYR